MSFLQKMSSLPKTSFFNDGEEKMKIEDYYLVITENGTAKLTKNLCLVKGNDVVIDLSIEIPDVLFERTRFVASIEVDEKDVNTVEVPSTTKIHNAIRQTGLNIQLEIIEKKDKQ